MGEASRSLTLGQERLSARECEGPVMCCDAAHSGMKRQEVKSQENKIPTPGRDRTKPESAELQVSELRTGRF